MKQSATAIGLGLVGAIAPWLSGAQDRVVAPGAKLEKLAGGFEFTEGPTCDAEGNVFFTDQPNDRILKWSVDGQAGHLPAARRPRERDVLRPRGQPGRLRRREEPRCGRSRRTARSRVILDKYEGKLLNGPNDVWVRPDGALYFTDPFYQRSWWTHDTMPQDGEHVYFLSADRQTPRRA